MDYKVLGGLSISLLGVAFILSMFELMGKLGRKVTYVVSGTVLILFFAVSALSYVIWLEYR